MKLFILVLLAVIDVTSPVYAGVRNNTDSGIWTVFVKTKEGAWTPEVLYSVMPETKHQCETVASQFREWSPTTIRKTICVKLPIGIAEKYKQMRDDNVVIKQLPAEVRRRIK